MLSFICVSTSTFTQQSQTDALLWFTTDSQGQGVIYSSQNQVHTLIKILGYHLGSFTSHYVGDIDKQQCRFTDWSYIQRQHHNEISTLTWSIMTLMKPWSPALSFLLISCVSVEGFWADSRIENHFLLCSCWIQASKPHVYYNKTYKAIPFRLHQLSCDSVMSV